MFSLPGIWWSNLIVSFHADVKSMLGRYEAGGCGALRDSAGLCGALRGSGVPARRLFILQSRICM